MRTDNRPILPSTVGHENDDNQSHMRVLMESLGGEYMFRLWGVNSWRRKRGEPGNEWPCHASETSAGG